MNCDDRRGPPRPPPFKSGEYYWAWEVPNAALLLRDLEPDEITPGVGANIGDVMFPAKDDVRPTQICPAGRIR